jgi:hypothetical protein
MQKMNWISVKDQLPIVPAGSYGITVLAVFFDAIYEEINPGKGMYVDESVWDGKHFLTLGISMGEPKCEFYPSFEPVLYWMPVPAPPELKK